MCWYNHDKMMDRSENAQFNCTKCDKEFTYKHEFMHHKKDEHRHSVPVCKNQAQGTCVFGEYKCWFRHNTEEEKDELQNKAEKDENKEVMERLFNMMENVTKRVVRIEERNK